MSYPTLSRTIEGFVLAKSASGLSANTIRNYQTDLCRFTEWVGDRSIDSITSKQLEQFIKYLRDDFRITHIATTKVTPRKLSSKSIKNTWGTLSSFWNWVSREFELPNPFSVPAIKAHTKPIDPLSMETIERLILVCDSSTKKSQLRKSYISKRSTAKRDKAIILTLLDTGMRVSELCGIDISTVDFDMGRILVTGKGNKQRFVYLGKVSKQAVWRYLTERFPNDAPPKDEPLFVNQDGFHRMTRYGVLLLLKRLGKKIGVLGVHPHRFRHTFAIQFLRNGGNVFELQQLLGHSDLEMVRNYVKLAQLDLEVIARKASPVDNWRLR